MRSRWSAPAGRARRCARWWRAAVPRPKMAARGGAGAEGGGGGVEGAQGGRRGVPAAEPALDPATPVIHPALGDNLTFERVHSAGDPDNAFAEADSVVEATFVFGRHTGVTNEPRAIVADW